MEPTVFITGTSSGIGKATARIFLEHGWQVAATMRTPEKETELSEWDKVKLYKLDVTDPASIQSALDKAIADFGKIDVLVNNAGYALTGPFEEMSEAQIRRQFETNVFGLMAVTRAILPHFRFQGGGVIVNLASVAGRTAIPTYSPYHATKWAVEGFTESLSYELEPFNIRVKLIEPGPIKTDFYDRSMDSPQMPSDSPYFDYVNRVNKTIMATAQNGYPPEIVAKVIYKAATDNSNRLRYPADPMAKMSLIFRRLLPDRIFMSVIRSMTRKSK